MTNWQAHELGQIVKIDRSSLKPDQIKHGTTYLGLEHIQSGGKIIGSQTVRNGELKSSKFEFSPAHLLYGKLRPYLAKIAAPDFPGICSTDIIPLLPGPDVDRKYLLYFLRQERMVDFANSRASGANLPRLSPKQLSKFKVPLPPLPEQKRIAKILDAADALRARRRESLDQLDALLQSTFLEMFGDPVTNPKGWIEKEFDEIVVDRRLGLVRSSKEFGWEFKVPYVRMDALTNDGKFLPEKVQFTEASDKEIDAFSLQRGDFLFNTRNSKELVGKVCVFPGPEGWLYNNNLMRIRFKEGIEPSVIAQQFQFRRVQRELEMRKSGTTSVFAVYWKSLRTLPVLVPSVDAQSRFATIVESIEQQKTRLRAHLAELDAMFASLQARAFAGEL